VFAGTLSAALTSANYSFDPQPVPSFYAQEQSFLSGQLSGQGGPGYAGEPSSNSYSVKEGYFCNIFPDTSDPSPAGMLTAFMDGDGNALLSWKGASDTESWINGYRVFRAAGEEGEYKAAGATDGTSFTDSAGLILGVTYYYKVKPVDAGGNTSVAGDPVAKVESNSFAVSVTNLSALPCTGGTVRLSWTEPKGAAFYRVYRTGVFGDTGTVICADGAVSASPFLDTLSNGLADGQRYYYTVRYVDGLGNEQQKGNNQANAPCDASPPSESKPCSSTHPTGTTVENNSPEFLWNEALDQNSASGGSGGMGGYRIFLSRESGLSYSPAWELTGSFKKSYTAVDDGDWYFYVSAEDRAGNYRSPSICRISILTKGEIAGKLTAKDGALPVSLLVELLSGGERVTYARAEADGSFSFKGVPFGVYSVRVLIPGSAPFQTELLSISKDSPKVLKTAVLAPVPVIGSGEISAYPNPVRGKSVTFIYPSEPGSTVKIELFDQAGRRVQSLFEVASGSPMSETSCGTEELKSGIYFYVIRTTDSSSINKKYGPKSFTVVKR